MRVSFLGSEIEEFFLEQFGKKYVILLLFRNVRNQGLFGTSVLDEEEFI
jgi:hypothetical protein